MDAGSNLILDLTLGDFNTESGNEVSSLMLSGQQRKMIENDGAVSKVLDLNSPHLSQEALPKYGSSNKRQDFHSMSEDMVVLTSQTDDMFDTGTVIGKAHDETSGERLHGTLVLAQESGRLLNQGCGRLLNQDSGRLLNQGSGRLLNQGSGRLLNQGSGRLLNQDSGRPNHSTNAILLGRANSFSVGQSEIILLHMNQSKLVTKSCSRYNDNISSTITDKGVGKDFGNNNVICSQNFRHSECGTDSVDATERSSQSVTERARIGKKIVADELETLWRKAELIMAAKEKIVLQVLEEFGIGEVDDLQVAVEEETVWQAMQDNFRR